MNAAMAYYRSMQPNQQSLAHDFFKALDTDGSGTVSLSEFLEFLRVVGLVNNRNGTVLFSLFDRDGNGTLDFFEVVALFHFLTIGAGAQLQQSAARSGDLRRLSDEKVPCATSCHPT